MLSCYSFKTCLWTEWHCTVQVDIAVNAMYSLFLVTCSIQSLISDIFPNISAFGMDSARLYFCIKGSVKYSMLNIQLWNWKDFFFLLMSSMKITLLAVVPAAAMGKLPRIVRASDPWIRHLQRERLQTALWERPCAERVQLSNDTYARCVSVNQRLRTVYALIHLISCY